MGVGKKVDVSSSHLGLNPTGLQYSTDNQFVQRLKELQDSAAVEKIPLIPSTPEEMSEMLQLCSYVRFKVPQQVTWLQQRHNYPPQRPGREYQLPARIPSFTYSLTPCPLLYIFNKCLCSACNTSGTVPAQWSIQTRRSLGRHGPVRGGRQ